MNLEDQFCVEINLPISNILPLIHKEVKENVYYKSGTNYLRADASQQLRQLLQELIEIPFFCCGFHKNLPGQYYPLHIDSKRKSALNILLTEENDDFDVGVLVNSSQKHKIPYRTNVPLLLNTKKVHYVKNNSASITRHIMTIGFSTHDYFQMKDYFFQKVNSNG